MFQKRASRGRLLLAGVAVAALLGLVALLCRGYVAAFYFFIQAEKCNHLRRYETAVPLYTKALALNPDWGRAYAQRGICYFMLDKADLALADLDTAIGLGYRSARVYFWKGFSCGTKRDNDSALSNLNIAVRLAPRWDAPYVLRAAAYYDKGDTNQALLELDRAIFLNPRSYKAYELRADLSRKQGNLAGALSDYDAAIKYRTNFHASLWKKRSNIVARLESQIAYTQLPGQARSLPTTWRMATNAFGYPPQPAITFTYYSALPGNKIRELNDEIISAWPYMSLLANRSGLTQALVIANVNQTNSPPDWRAPHVLRFERSEAGEWKLKSLCEPDKQ